MLAVTPDIGGGEILAGEAGLLHAGVAQLQPAGGLLRRLVHAVARGDLAARDRAVIFLGQRAYLLHRHIAGDHHEGVIRHVPALVPVQRVLGRERAHLRFPADDRDTVGVVEILRGAHLLTQDGAGVVVDTLAAFLQDHIAFRQHHRVSQRQIGHAVGLQLHHQFQPVGGDGLEVGGVVPGSEGVILAAIAVDNAAELAGGQVAGAAEHQMFQEMRDAGGAALLVGRPGAVPDHVGDDRDAVVLHHDHLQPVFQREALRIEDGGPAWGGGYQQQRQHGAEVEKRSEDGVSRQGHGAFSSGVGTVR